MAMALCAGRHLRPAYGVEAERSEKELKIAASASDSAVLDPMPPHKSAGTPIGSRTKLRPHLPFIESQQWAGESRAWQLPVTWGGRKI